jgi:hypothetical protein
VSFAITRILPAIFPEVIAVAEGVAEGIMLEEEAITDIVEDALTAGVLEAEETNVLVNEGKDVGVVVEGKVTKDEDPVTMEEEVNDSADEVVSGELLVTPEVCDGGTGAMTLGTP